MSIEKPLREMVQAELKTRLAPVHKAITRMDERLGVIAEIVDIIHRLAPLATRMQTLQMALPGMTLPIAGRGRAATPTPAAPAPAPAPEPAPRQAAAPSAPAAPTPPARPPLSYPASRYALPTPPPTVRPEPSADVPAPRERQSARSPAPARSSGKAPTRGSSEAGRKCAVIGCKRASRSKGYCSAHYQKLRLLVKSGRRPANWTDDASPQSIEDVVLPRGRAAAKAREETPPPAPVRPEPPKPKAWVRKKGEKDRGAPLN